MLHIYLLLLLPLLLCSVMLGLGVLGLLLESINLLLLPLVDLLLLLVLPFEDLYLPVLFEVQRPDLHDLLDLVLLPLPVLLALLLHLLHHDHLLSLDLLDLALETLDPLLLHLALLLHGYLLALLGLGHGQLVLELLGLLLEVLIDSRLLLHRFCLPELLGPFLLHVQLLLLQILDLLVILVLHGLHELLRELLLLLDCQLQELLSLLDLVLEGHDHLLLLVEVSAHQGVLVFGLLEALDDKLLLFLVLGHR